MKLVELGRAVARGRTAEIFVLDEKRVLKLFQLVSAHAAAQHEFAIAQAVHACGVPAPRAHELIVVEGRAGIVYDRVNADSMLKRLSSRPWQARKLAHLLADLHVGIHKQSAQGLPLQRERAVRHIGHLDVLTADEKANVLAKLNLLPVGTSLCHGDFHPDNVLLAADGPCIIDWANATSGNLNADVQWTSLVLRLGEVPATTPSFMRMLISWMRRTFHDSYFNRYISASMAWKLDIDAWAVPCAALRLADDIPEERDYLLSLVRTSPIRNSIE